MKYTLNLEKSQFYNIKKTEPAFKQAVAIF